MKRTYKSTRIISKGLGLFGILTLLLIVGFTAAHSQKWWAVIFLIAIQLLVLVIWYNGYKVGYQITTEVIEDENE